MPIARLWGHFGFALLLVAMNASFSAGARADSPQPVIGLFTDYGWDDPYVAQMKGTILTINPGARILDLTHSTTPFNVMEGAYLLDQCAVDFPPATIFVAVVDPSVGTDRAPILVETAKAKFYVGPDNGIFSEVIDREGFTGAWKLDKYEFFRANSAEAISHTFHGRDIFGPIAAHLAAGVDPDKMGTAVAQKDLTLLPSLQPTFLGGAISVKVLHIDRYGNVVTNLSSDNEIASRLKEGNLVKIMVGKDSYSAPLVKTYAEVNKGRLLLLYGGSGLLEIGMNQDSAAKDLNVQPGSVIFLRP
jgi:S-adenosyl-L-methionine hydrolase (adenosine-forming)